MKYLFTYYYGATTPQKIYGTGQGAIVMTLTGTDKITEDTIFGERGAVNIVKEALEKDGYTDVKLTPMGWFKFDKETQALEHPIIQYEGKAYIADKLTMKTKDKDGYYSFYGFKEVDE